MCVSCIFFKHKKENGLLALTLVIRCVFLHKMGNSIFKMLTIEIQLENFIRNKVNDMRQS